ncbi:integrating conjugative element protein [Pseudomonas sp. Irchel 3A5]|uniref:integrating conjugative element protein n=1 Tax=Pseudomonas sp. Irchel 3A5 TaxID=2008911 RepID=UPI000BA3140E|nr:integrating conjugative element protein [Pseudomonas sp. Irchel 3A5]
MKKIFLFVLVFPALAHAELIVVEDLGGTSALPYYRALNLIPEDKPLQLAFLPPVPLKQYGEADMLPVKSTRLSPGKVDTRVLNAPGLQPMFLIGDDELSRDWLAARIDVLRELNAVGLVVNVEKYESLQELRRLANGLELAPASADQLAEILNLDHYPALITSTGLEQ